MSELFNSLEWFKRIEVLRTMKGWTQDKAAKECFTGQKNYWQWEAGKVYPRKNSRLAISRAFNVKEDEIFS